MNNRAYKGITGAPGGLEDVEVAAANLPSRGSKLAPADEQIEAFRKAQYKLWSGLRARVNPWLITDFVSVGTPMYFADPLYTGKRHTFEERVKRRELPTCPPQISGLAGRSEAKGGRHTPDATPGFLSEPAPAAG